VGISFWPRKKTTAIFNIHHGQVRIDKTSGGIATSGKWRETSPKRALMMASVRDGDTILYEADDYGNIVIEDAAHIKAAAALGYPLVVDSKLMWPDYGDPGSKYAELIQQHMDKGRLV